MFPRFDGLSMRLRNERDSPKGIAALAAARPCEPRPGPQCAHSPGAGHPWPCLRVDDRPISACPANRVVLALSSRVRHASKSVWYPPVKPVERCQDRGLLFYGSSGRTWVPLLGAQQFENGPAAAERQRHEELESMGPATGIQPRPRRSVCFGGESSVERRAPAGTVSNVSSRCRCFGVGSCANARHSRAAARSETLSEDLLH